MNLASSMNFMMTLPRYSDITHFLTDPDGIFTALCKIGRKRHFVHENYLIFGIFIEKIKIYYENYIYSAVTLLLSPFPLGSPLVWIFHIPEDTFSKQKRKSFYQNW